MAPIVPSVIDRISASMSVSGLQQQVIASNIANRDTQGYQRLRLQFDRAMDQAMDTPDAASITTASPGAPVSIEQDLVALSTNSMQYEAMARVLSRYFSLIGSITNPNRG